MADAAENLAWFLAGVAVGALGVMTVQTIKRRQWMGETGRAVLGVVVLVLMTVTVWRGYHPSTDAA